MRSRASATPSDDGKRRQPFRALQPRTRSCSPFASVLPTPPREVILTPKSVKRKTTSRSKRLSTKVKSEPPEIDLSKVRPPSPSDDPLLLSGTRSPPLRARFTPVFSSSPSSSACIDLPVSFAARLSGGRIRASESSSFSSDTHSLPVFDATPRVVEETSGSWSDSDDDEFNLTGEYTGKYRILKVPTTVDPPTREQKVTWGRPVSPFPFCEIMERSLPLSVVTEGSSGHDDANTPGSIIPYEDAAMWEVATEPPLSDVEPCVSEDEFAHLDDDFSVFDVDAESTRVLPFPERPDSDQIISEEEEEAQIDRELSVPFDDGFNVPLTLSMAKQGIGPTKGDSSDEEDDIEGEDIIKITSEDPKAAARAAAILRMHDYDCILAAEKKKRFGRRSSKLTRNFRKTIENAGISKSYTDLKKQRWQTLHGNITSPGSRSLPLLELWQDAEDSVFLEHHSTSCDASFTLSPLKALMARSEPMLPPLTGEWNRDLWKCLDKCLVAERLAVAAARGLGTDVLVDAGDISKDAVLNRFVKQLGGESIMAGLGSEWSRHNLTLRLDVLIRKQSRDRTRTLIIERQDSLGTDLGYRGLLQQAMALSEPLERCPTSALASSDVTVHPRDTSKMMTLPDESYSELSWQTSYLRGSVRTLSRTPDPRPPHPKDQVHLRHASLPQTSMIPVPIRPKRLVDLRHLSPIKSDQGGWRPGGRRSSGCSVRDLVRQFESLDK